VAAVLGAVRRVDLVVDAGVGLLHEGDVFLNAAGPDPAFVVHLRDAEPGTAAPLEGSDVEVVAEADDPNRHRVSQCAVTSEWRDLQLFCCSDLVELVARPRRRGCVSFVMPVAMTAFPAGRSAWAIFTPNPRRPAPLINQTLLIILSFHSAWYCSSLTFSIQSTVLPSSCS
jgi:hypothetical protein